MHLSNQLRPVRLSEFRSSLCSEEKAAGSDVLAEVYFPHNYISKITSLLKSGLYTSWPPANSPELRTWPELSFSAGRRFCFLSLPPHLDLGPPNLNLTIFITKQQLLRNWKLRGPAGEGRVEVSELRDGLGGRKRNSGGVQPEKLWPRPRQV